MLLFNTCHTLSCVFDALLGCYWSVPCIYTLYQLLHVIHACGSSYTVVYLFSLGFVAFRQAGDTSCPTNKSRLKVPLPIQQIRRNPLMEAEAQQLLTEFFPCLRTTSRRNWKKKGRSAQKRKIEKEVVQLKYEGNQKQFELNAELDTILGNIETEADRTEPNLALIKKYTQEARQLIRKRQKLIKIADKSKDGWQVVAEYESDELASGSEDEKHLKKAREAASRKRRQKDQVASDREKRPRVSTGADNQLFRGRNSCLHFTL